MSIENSWKRKTKKIGESYEKKNRYIYGSRGYVVDC